MLALATIGMFNHTMHFASSIPLADIQPTSSLVRFSSATPNYNNISSNWQRQGNFVIVINALKENNKMKWTLTIWIADGVHTHAIMRPTSCPGDDGSYHNYILVLFYNLTSWEQKPWHELAQACLNIQCIFHPDSHQPTSSQPPAPFSPAAQLLVSATSAETGQATL